MKQFNYEYLLELGFKRLDINDSVFEKQHGFSCFYLIKKLQKGINITWDCEAREAQLRRFKKGDILSRYNIGSDNELEMIIKFFLEQDAKVINPVNKNFDFSNIA